MFSKGKDKNLKQAKAHFYQPGYGVKVQPAQHLLKSQPHQDLLRQLQGYTGLPDKYYEYAYTGLIERFAGLVQVLPEKSNDYLGSLLNHSLIRAYATLTEYVKSQQSMLGRQVTIDPLLLYAIFTAALFAKVNVLMTTVEAIVTDDKGNFIAKWLPLESRLKEQGDYYKIFPIFMPYSGVPYALNVLFARQLLGEELFEWIASDQDIFLDWLSALQANEHLEGRVVDALKVTYLDIEELQELIEIVLPPQEVETKVSSETQHGEAFLTWLRDNLEKGEISVNQKESSVHMLDSGAFIDQKIFADFSKIYAANVSATVVAHQFGNLLGFYKKGGHDFSFDQFFNVNPEAGGAGMPGARNKSFVGQMHQSKQASTRMGLSVEDVRLLFSNPTIPASSKYVRTAPGKDQKRVPGMTVSQAQISTSTPGKPNLM